MKKLFKFAAIVAAAAALFSCQEKPTPEPTPDPDKPGQEQEPENKEPNANIQFTLEIIEVTETTAKVKIKHDGAKTDTWHYFATTETEIADAIEAEVEKLLAEGKSLQSSTSKTTTIRNLTPETEYTLVAFGITTEGTLYGEPETLAFKTLAEPVVIDEYQINPAWTVEYIGDYEYEGEILEHVVYVESTDNNTYFTTAWPKASFEEYGIKTIAEAEIASWIEYLGKYGYTIEYILSDKTSLSQVDIDTAKYGNEWYIIAIGADVNGNPTGYYAMSELITFTEEEMTEDYAAWLGNWTFTGSNGVSFDVTMSKGRSNQTYKLTGWEGPESEGLDITVEWMAEQGIWVIFAQYFGTFSFGEDGNGEVWLVPESTDGYIYPKEGIPACLGGFTEDGERAVIGYSEEAEDGSVVEMATMLYLAKLEVDGKWYSITSATEWPTFPFTVTAATKATTNAVPEFKGAKKYCKELKDFQTFGVKNVMTR